MVISNDFEIGYLVVAFGLLGVILIGTMLTALYLERCHPKLLGAVVATLLCVALIEVVPLESTKP